VEATLDGRLVGKQTVALKSWEERDLAFDAQLDKSGSHNVVFSLPPDALAADNQAFLVVQAVARIPVVVVGDDNADQQGTGTYFLTRALAPRGDMGDDLEVRHLTSGDLSANGFARLGDAEAVMIGYVGKLAPDALRALYMYANQGGGVAIFFGEGPVADNMLSFGALAKQGDCLPWLPTGPRDLSLHGGVLQLGEGDWKHPALADFDEPSQQALRQIRFFKVWMSGAMKPNAVSILKFADGTPALAAQALGQGKVVLANFSPALACSDIGKYGSFVAMMHSMVHYLRPRRDWRSQSLTGDALRMAIPDSRDPARTYQVLGPDQRDRANRRGRRDEPDRPVSGAAGFLHGDLGRANVRAGGRQHRSARERPAADRSGRGPRASAKRPCFAGEFFVWQRLAGRADPSRPRQADVALVRNCRHDRHRRGTGLAGGVEKMTGLNVAWASCP
jgi:hypothetical protein